MGSTRQTSCSSMRAQELLTGRFEHPPGELERIRGSQFRTNRTDIGVPHRQLRTETGWLDSELCSLSPEQHEVDEFDVEQQHFPFDVPPEQHMLSV
ncbi:hypothetical protein KOR42_00140 [Thalassoglobus neptunius]|uniref:Uncharacterized protein n=1 Tax=Thalassoglobus neptunius TaxID=1938619 RepID=A0A5C5X311_9PLAN|nr:hypothetical protein KOR42_00140 [Thalassoglobus neptunius]